MNSGHIHVRGVTCTCYHSHNTRDARAREPLKPLGLAKIDSSVERRRRQSHVTTAMDPCYCCTPERRREDAIVPLKNCLRPRSLHFDIIYV